MISIIIPIYPPNEDPKHIKNQVKKLLSFEGEKEIILVLEPFLDEDWKKLIEELKKYKNVKVFVNKERKGKVWSCNFGARQASGEYLLFIDADVLVNDPKLLVKIEKALKKYDYIDVIKEIIPTNLFGKIMYYEYIGMNLFQYLFAKTFKKLFSINGAFIAIRKDVFLKVGGFSRFIVEDVEFATRLALNDKTAYFLEDIKIFIEPLESFKRWIDQRKRWAYGGAEWLKYYWKRLIKYAIKHPKILLGLVFLLLYIPAIIPFLILLFLPNMVWIKLSYLLILLLSIKFSPLIYILIPWLELASFLKNLFLFILAYIITAIIYFYFAKKFRMKFNLLYFTIYYFFYSPLWLLIIITVFIGYFIFEKEFKIDWKV